jgi:hypothetical protein
VYRPRDAEHTVLHQVVAEHLEAFLGAVAEAGDGTGLPQSSYVRDARRVMSESIGIPPHLSLPPFDTRR